MENTIRGHHIAIYDATTFLFKGYYLFDVAGGVASVSTNYKNFLDTLTSNYIVIFSICSEGGGANLTTSLKTSIKSFGSVLIDNINLDHSWAMIGRKGAVAGGVPEKDSNRLEVEFKLIPRLRYL